jgi:CRISPR-associated exonuclease Cas4
VGFSEDDLLPLSALQHLVFCERQCALIHIEQSWADNALTVEGTHLHRRAHDGPLRRELRGDVLTVRGLAIHSFRLGVSGIADVVEFHQEAGLHSDVASRPTVALPGLRGRWLPRPVEYKRGRPKSDRCDEVQLCAQAMCLEEMLEVHVTEGALFYGAPQRRHAVRFDAELRQVTEAAADRLHTLFQAGLTPGAKRQPKCRSCSLAARCRPDALSTQRVASRYVHEAVATVLGEDGDHL